LSRAGTESTPLGRSWTYREIGEMTLAQFFAAFADKMAAGEVRKMAAGEATALLAERQRQKEDWVAQELQRYA